MCLKALATSAGGLAAGQNSFISCYDWHFYTHMQACMHESMLSQTLSLSVSLFNTLTHHSCHYTCWYPFSTWVRLPRSQGQTGERDPVCACVCVSLKCSAHVSSSACKSLWWMHNSASVVRAPSLIARALNADVLSRASASQTDAWATLKCLRETHRAFS